jgi:hypothetical protein
MGARRVMLCNQASDFGSKLQQILDLYPSILAERRLFTELVLVSRSDLATSAPGAMQTLELTFAAGSAGFPD